MVPVQGLQPARLGVSSRTHHAHVTWRVHTHTHTGLHSQGLSHISISRERSLAQNQSRGPHALGRTGRRGVWPHVKRSMTTDSSATGDRDSVPCAERQQPGDQATHCRAGEDKWGAHTRSPFGGGDQTRGQPHIVNELHVTELLTLNS